MDLKAFEILDATVEKMLQLRIRRLNVSGVEVELHDSAFSPKVDETPSEAPKPDPKCPCGHDPETEHSPEGYGCLFGCRAETCLSKKDKEE